MALTTVEDRSNYGSISRDEDELISAFKEKSPELKSPGLINAGVYLLEPKILQWIPPAQKISIERETFPILLQKKLRLGGFASNVFFVDIGTPEGFYRFKEYIKEEVA
jgi:mannose-1-phosphate guanylyltransferase